MRNSKILAASLAGAMFAAASSSAFGASTFSLLPMDLPTTGIDCTAITGVKNRGMIITVFKAAGDASANPHDDLLFFQSLGVDIDNVGDLWKFFAETFGECSTPAG